MNNHTLALEITNLTKTYRGKITALSNIKLHVDEGDFFALLGPNGAGKSTAIGIISSLVKKTDGQVKIFEIDIDDDFEKAKSLIGIVPQEINFNQFETVSEIIINQAGYFGIDRKTAKIRTNDVLKQTQLWEKRDEVSRNLSGGMKRRLMISRALVHQPKLLILDEPTAGVDIEVRRSMWEFLSKLNESGTTIILTTHYLEEAERLCRNIAIIDNGEIVENTSMKALLQKLRSETFLFECATDVEKMPTLQGTEVTQLDARRFEIVIDNGRNLNQIFKTLSDSGIPVSYTHLTLPTKRIV